MQTSYRNAFHAVLDPVHLNLPGPGIRSELGEQTLLGLCRDTFDIRQN